MSEFCESSSNPENEITALVLIRSEIYSFRSYSFALLAEATVFFILVSTVISGHHHLTLLKVKKQKRTIKVSENDNVTAQALQKLQKMSWE